MVSEDEMVIASKDSVVPLAGFQIKIHDCARSFFSMAVETTVGDGANILFWKDRWLHGQRLEDIAPLLFAAVPTRKANERTVLQALTDQSWIPDIQGVILVGILTEFLNLWDLLLDIGLQPGVESSHRWHLSASGLFSAKSGY